MKLRSLLFALAMSLPMFAQQPPAYTQSVTFNCNQEVCNGLPLDGGGDWQFILANQAFSINVDSDGDYDGFYIFGNPGNPGTGGIDLSSVQYNLPNPPQYGGRGAEGTLAFDWTAVTPDRSLHYAGHVMVTGYQRRFCGRHGCWNNLTIDSAQIYIDSVQ